MRVAVFNTRSFYVDSAAAHRLGQVVVRVPAYSPFAIAEHTAGLILALNRKIHRAYARVREGNLSLEGLVDFDLHARTVGIIGTGKIGLSVELPELYAESDIISLHCPLTPETFHLINTHTLPQMKRGVMLINTGRGGLIHGKAVVEALKSSQNVLITGHQAWLTEDALLKIAEITLSNLADLENGRKCLNEVTEENASQMHEWSEEEIERTLLAEQLQKWVPD